MTITLCNGKGGTGKTTLTVLLATALADAGHKVGVQDRDPQGTATKWLAESPVAGVELARPGGEYAAILVDTPPHASHPALAAAIREAELVVVVSSPSPADLWASRDTADLVKQHLNAKSRARIVFNQVQAHTVLARELDDLAKRIGLKPCKSTVSRRQCYQHAPLVGWGGLNAEAREEIRRLAIELLAQ
jgi:chromosome partitioning protein